MCKIIFPIVQKHGVYKIFLASLQTAIQSHKHPICPHQKDGAARYCRGRALYPNVKYLNVSPTLCHVLLFDWLNHLNPIWKQQKSSSHLLCSLVNDVLLGRENLSSVNPSAMIFWFGSAGHCPSSKAGRANIEQSSEIVVLQKKHRWLLRRCREIQRWQDWCLQGKKKVSISQA